MFIIRFIFYFILSFSILCIPVGSGLQLFDKLYNLVTPYAERAILTTKQKLTTTKRYSKKLYSNSEPFEKDEVKIKFSGIKKKIEIKKNSSDDSYTDEERERLRKVLKND